MHVVIHYFVCFVIAVLMYKLFYLFLFRSSASAMYANYNIRNFEAILKNVQFIIIQVLILSWYKD